MDIHDVRLDRWYKAPDGRVGQAAIIDNNLTHDVFLRGADFSVWVKAAELEPADAPDATPSEPLKVGDEVWIKGTVAATCPDKGNYRIDFGMGSCWCAPNTEIKRA